MKTFRVGGSVRDELLGLPVQDHDHVVVGADPAQMAALGFRPVGADFPVFLHPVTHEEYALARTERKTAPGYKGFVFHADSGVTLEEDLRRRDLTINAMARAEDGTLVDPYGGEKDLRAGVLRHVSEAFAEDPVRILRVARFAARFGFSIAPETMALMKRMVQAGEADSLVPERVWQELSRGLMEKAPSRMVAVLWDCGALERILPEVAQTAAMAELASRLDRASARGYPLAVRFSLLLLDLTVENVDSLSRRVNAPNDCRELARLCVQEGRAIRDPGDAGSMLSLLERCDALRRPDRFERVIEVLECAATDVPRASLMAALDAARAIDAGAVARDNPSDIPGAIRRARLAAMIKTGV